MCINRTHVRAEDAFLGLFRRARSHGLTSWPPRAKVTFNYAERTPIKVYDSLAKPDINRIANFMQMPTYDVSLIVGSGYLVASLLYFSALSFASLFALLFSST